MHILRSSAARLSLPGCLLLAAGCAASYSSLGPGRADAGAGGACRVTVFGIRGAREGSAAVRLGREIGAAARTTPVVDRGEATGAAADEAYLAHRSVLYANRGHRRAVEAYLRL